ncbi:MAG: carboxymuconolactone decarboxylase family protein [Acidimicrobiia bacterium]|nr:carboxymuconolactone decarboxylase family protein [Acidimicrobiia bacterium]
MDDYLPTIYTRFRSAYPEVAGSLDAVGAAVDAVGALDERSMRLVKLGIAIGAQSEGGVRSSVRKAVAVGVTPDEVRHATLLAITTAGFPTAMAALQWADEVIDGA